MPDSKHSEETASIVQRILNDTAGCRDPRLTLVDATPATRGRLIETLRGQDVPVLSTGGACGPG